MKRLTVYLVRQFAIDTAGLFVIMLIMVWMTQWLRMFDLVSDKGQGMLTLFGQAALSLPPLAVVFFYATMGIGLGRALVRLQSSHELHIIHASRQVPALLKAVAVYAGIGAVLVVLASNSLAPAATRQLDSWTASIAADLVSRSLTPHHFTEVAPGVTLAIGGRADGGRITDFFADDRRDPSQERTYIARTARVGENADGYVLQLEDGKLQYLEPGGQMSQISFGRYNIAIDRLTSSARGTDLDSRSTIALVAGGLRSGTWPQPVLRKLAERADEPLRVFGMCLLVAAIMAWPHARRGRGGWLPIEIVVILVGFAERGLTAYAPLPYLVQPLTGGLALIIIALAILAWRLRLFRPVRRARRGVAA